MNKNKNLTNIWNVDPEHREREAITQYYEGERDPIDPQCLTCRAPEYICQMEILERRIQREYSGKGGGSQKKKLELNTRQSWKETQRKMKMKWESVGPYEEILSLKEKKLEKNA